MTQGWPAALNEYTSTWGIELVASISRPFARCHQRSGSSGGTAAMLKMAVNRRTRSTTVLVTRRSRVPTLASPRGGGPLATLAHHPNDETGQSEHAAPAPGLAAQAVQPLQAPIPHPAGSPAHPARDEVEGSAHAHADRGAGRAQVPGEPGLLGAGPVGQKEQLGAAGADRLDGGGLARGIGGAGVCAGQDEAGVRIAQRPPSRLRHPRTAAEQEEPPALRGAASRERVDEVDAGYPLWQRTAQP